MRLCCCISHSSLIFFKSPVLAQKASGEFPEAFLIGQFQAVLAYANGLGGLIGDRVFRQCHRQDTLSIARRDTLGEDLAVELEGAFKGSVTELAPGVARVRNGVGSGRRSIGTLVGNSQHVVLHGERDIFFHEAGRIQCQHKAVLRSFDVDWHGLRGSAEEFGPRRAATVSLMAEMAPPVAAAATAAGVRSLLRLGGSCLLIIHGMGEWEMDELMNGKWMNKCW